MIFKDRFKGRTAIVTGGATGIGLDVASRLAAEGATVSLWDLKGDSLANVKVELALRTTPCWT
jgi:NAD(P)-dependent dehydrogenase (short-subunit alcohol dehydrogenase family)